LWKEGKKEKRAPAWEGKKNRHHANFSHVRSLLNPENIRIKHFIG
jgi:hypothetical protein